VSDTNPDLAAQEVDEELRRDQLKALWKAYGKFVVGGAIGVVLAVGGYQLNTYLTQSSQEEASSAFAAALEASSQKAGSEAADVWADAANGLEGGYEALANIRAAQALAAEGRVAEAVVAYDKVTAASDVDLVLRDYAGLMAALLLVETDLVAARGRFVTLSTDEAPWKFSAKEQLAYIELKEGRFQEAYDQFAALASDSGTPQTISLRAQQFRDMLESKLSAQAEDATEAGVVDEG